MLDQIIHFSIRNKLVIGICTLALVAWGCYSLTRLPIDAVPDITNNQVQIITTSPSLAAQEVERLVTFPVETVMATIPRTEEIRSISRFGLSVVTIVFEDDADVYWARQQVAERLGSAIAQIPPGTGTPELAPITTGLGEIYQYVLHTRPGFESQYSPMELRSMQDWIVRRQLLGTTGVADVSSFGGFLKQYEITIDPLRLRSAGLSIARVFEALEQNNQNTGGAYIDKKPNAYFIRSEGLIGTLDDIRNIRVAETAGDLPILIRDIATVGYGSAVRYGAMTRNNEGEVVGGLVLMLKGANSSEVIGHVKERIAQIRKSLPEGVVIEPFLDRTKLVGNAISTVTTNLIEGALIVIFVLILLLGNLRAGLVVASVIPLAMLFAVSMMNLFGVSGNLMSLGAIDFGLIVDGAVIIVEATLHHLVGKRYTHRLTQDEMDREVYESASRIRNSAAFGEIIILIVYLPILALVGIEGKMFRPMAQTVSFAILGAFILSLTYIPMMSALFLSKNNDYKPGVSERIVAFFRRLYLPALEVALRRKWIVSGIAVLMLGGSVWIFLRLGGEFIPQLDEGDFAVELRVLTGSSLLETVSATGKAAAVLRKQFPDEVTEVVGKIGSSEIPTDPMPVEAADMMVILKEKSAWKKADSREELAEQMHAALDESIAGVTFGFQQPIQMRFNELMTGVKQDVAIKIFGEDLDVLARQAARVGKLARTVPGAEDVYVESVTGLPQIVVRFDRDKLSRFNIPIAEANRTLNAAFAGAAAGLVYEGEKRFDLVIRLQKADRQRIDDVRALFVTNAEGQQVPLGQLASIEMQTGANQIQREDAKRRITVAFNVRGRDVEHVMQELQSRIDREIKLPPGYFMTFGGQFEHLQEARGRLGVAVPVALLLIAVLLYFTFHSLRQTLLVLTAIPFSAIGGVVALWLRGMPFSISAGIGFIALFGVAVLNGIVLIAAFNQLRQAGETDLRKVIFEGTQTRLRPVMMTALVASLGFLPMALSSSAGAEVQRPLATVVIGGLVSATLLTLLVLPVWYAIVEQRWCARPGWVAGLLLCCLLPAGAHAQQPGAKKVSLLQAITEALERNPSLKGDRYRIDYQQALGKTAADWAKTDFAWMGGQYNSSRFDHHFLLSQNIPNPVTVAKRKLLLAAEVAGAQAAMALSEAELVRTVKVNFEQQVLLKSKLKLLNAERERTERFVRAAELRFRAGETNQLEYATAQSQLGDVRAQLIRTEAELLNLQRALQALTRAPGPAEAETDSLVRRNITLPDTAALKANPYLAYLAQQAVVDQKQTALQKAALLPELNAGYFNQSLIGFQNTGQGEVYYGAGKRFQGVQLGLQLPIFNGAARARVKASQIAEQMAANRIEAARLQLGSDLQQATRTLQATRQNLDLYEQNTLTLAAVIRNNASRAYETGEIGYIEYGQAWNRAWGIEWAWLELLYAHNEAVIQIDFLLNEQ